MFKLAQGVFIAPTPLEQLYGSSDLVAHVFIYGRASMHSVAAAVVPSSLLKERGEDGESILRKVRRFKLLAQLTCLLGISTPWAKRWEARMGDPSDYCD